MWPLPIGELFLCGKESVRKLTAMGIRNIGDLANTPLKEVQAIIGVKHGNLLHNYANGIDDSKVIDVPEDAKGYSTETTPEDDLTDIESIDRLLLAQADMVTARMRADGAKCSCIGVTYRTNSFQNKSHQRKLMTPTNGTTEVYEVARQLLRECWQGQPLRLIGIALTDVTRGEFEQFSFNINPKNERLKQLDKAVDSIRGKFGNGSVMRASTMDQRERVSRRYQAEQANRVDRKYE